MLRRENFQQHCTVLSWAVIFFLQAFERNFFLKYSWLNSFTKPLLYIPWGKLYIAYIESTPSYWITFAKKNSIAFKFLFELRKFIEVYSFFLFTRVMKCLFTLGNKIVMLIPSALKMRKNDREWKVKNKKTKKKRNIWCNKEPSAFTISIEYDFNGCINRKRF